MRDRADCPHLSDVPPSRRIPPMARPGLGPIRHPADLRWRRSHRAATCFLSFYYKCFCCCCCCCCCSLAFETQMYKFFYSLGLLPPFSFACRARLVLSSSEYIAVYLLVNTFELWSCYGEESGWLVSLASVEVECFEVAVCCEPASLLL